MEPKLADAFGMTLLACHAADGQPGLVHEITERDDGLIRIGDPSRYFPIPEGDDADWVLQRTRGRVLDVGAGAGRYSLAAQDRGCDILALDISEGALEVCRVRGVHQTYLGTVTDLAATAPEPFDRFLLMGNNLGLLAAPEDAVHFLAALDTLATPDALIVAEGNDSSVTEDPEHLRYHAWNRERGLHPHLIRLRVRFSGYATNWFDYLMPSSDELAEILEHTPWTIEELQPFPGRLAGRYLTTFRKR